MTQIENPDKKIKINSTLFEEFTSPISENPQTYLRVNANGMVEYVTPDTIAVEIGGSTGTTISDWNNSIPYVEGQIVIYKNNLFKCTNPDYVVKSDFDYSDWQIIAGYQQYSSFYNSDEPIETITLEKPISSKGFIQINVDNSILQTDQYQLEEDGVTVRFNEPIPANSQINVVSFGNFTLVDGSRIASKELIANEGQTEFELGFELQLKDLATINVENTQLLQSEWELSPDRHTIILKNPLQEGDRLQVLYWENLQVEIGVTFTPKVERNDGMVEISWENDGDRVNPETVQLYDGALYTPKTSKNDYITTISWENDRGLENPEPVEIKDGATYYPTLSKDGVYTTISWDNNQGEPNPSNAIIEDGATFTPHIERDLYETTISWTNDKGLQNPEPITIYNNFAIRKIESFLADDEQEVFVAQKPIYDKSLLSVNVSNSELTTSSYELGEDKRTVTLLNGVEKGSIVELKYFINANFDASGLVNTFYTPITTELESSWELSWVNNSGLQNPEPIKISKGRKISNKGNWDETLSYNESDIVTYKSGNYEYGFIALKDIPANTDIDDRTCWNQLYRTYTKEFIDNKFQDLQNQINELKNGS